MGLHQVIDAVVAYRQRDWRVYDGEALAAVKARFADLELGSMPPLGLRRLLDEVSDALLGAERYVLQNTPFVDHADRARAIDLSRGIL